MATFKECVEAAKLITSFEIGRDFDDVEFVAVELNNPIVFKARAGTKLILTSQDSNEEIDKFYKVVTRK